MDRPKHRNGEEVAMTAVLPFVQFLVRNGQGFRFCWDELRRLPSTADGLMYLTKIVAKLPVNLRTEARNLVEYNIPDTLLAKAS